MGKIFEAMERARKESSEQKETPGSPDPSGSFPEKAKPEMESEMILLFRNIDALLPGKPKRVIQFIGARGGEGTSTIVWEFARVSASLLGKSVFLYDGQNKKRAEQPSKEPPPRDSENAATQNEEGGEDLPERQDGTNLPVCLVSHRQALTLKSFFSRRIDDIWEILKQDYDMIVIDSPAASASPEGIALARSVDGVVLVVEAEKTRWPVAENLKTQIERGGGKILGVVFNKRRYYIPDYIYKWF